MKSFYILLISLISFHVSAQGNWEKKSSIPGVARHHPVTFALNGKGYVATGLASPSFLLQDFFEYDPTTDTWTQKTSFPGIARSFAYGVTHNGKAYLGFGLGTGNQRLNDFWEYDPATDQWTQLSDCGCTGRRHPAMVATDNGKIFVGMGDDLNGDQNDWWEYDIATNTWTQKGSLPGPRRHHPYYFGIGSDTYVGFGHSGLNIYNDFYRYNSVSETWTQMRDFPGEARVAGAQFNYDAYGYIISGEGADHQNLDSGEFFRYDPRLDSWFEQEVHPGPGRWATGTFVIDDMVYLVAGEDDRSIMLNDMWAYDLKRTTVIAGSDENLSSDEEIKAYPNPVSNTLYLNIQSTYTYSVNGFDGKTIMTGEADQLNKRIDMTELNAGIYLLQLSSEEGVSKTIKVFKK